MRTTLTKYFLSLALSLSAGALCVAGPVPMDKTVAPVAPMCDWTGFYVGVNGGVGWQQSRWTDSTGDVPYEAYEFGGASTTTWDNVNGLIGGQVGFNYQWRDLVIGIEADADYSGNSINKTRLYYPGENWYWQDRATINFQGSVRGRLGISMLDNKALIYVTGGAAFVHGDWEENTVYFPGTYGTEYNENWKGDDWRWGLIGGAGIEYRLNCHWSIKAEALYTWLAEDAENPSFVGSEELPVKFTFADEMYSGRIGINYNFGSFFGR